MQETITALLDHLDRTDPGEVVGVYLHGSAAAGGLRPDSDLDVLLVTRRSLDAAERRMLVTRLLELSGWSGHAGAFDDAVSRRPLELTSLVLDTRHAWSHPPRRDFQYGEWRRASLAAGELPQPQLDPDLTLVMAAARSNHHVVRGPALDRLVAAIPPETVRRAMSDALPELLESIEGDERNVLLTLARMLVTSEAGAIVSKDEAAARVAAELPPAHRELVELAHAGYLGVADDDWTTLRGRARTTAEHLAAAVHRATR